MYYILGCRFLRKKNVLNNQETLASRCHLDRRDLPYTPPMYSTKTQKGVLVASLSSKWLKKSDPTYSRVSQPKCCCPPSIDCYSINRLTTTPMYVLDYSLIKLFDCNLIDCSVDCLIETEVRWLIECPIELCTVADVDWR